MKKEKPDGNISVDDRQRILLFGRPVGYIKKGTATIDDSCHLIEVNRFVMSQCKSVRFAPGIARQMKQDEVISNAHHIRRARVYQLKPDTAPEMRFIGYEQLMARHGRVDPENYAVVFDGDVGSTDPETVYRLLRDSPPPDYRGHTLTRSDLLELYNPKESRFFYIDTFALKPVEYEPAGTNQEMDMQMKL